MTESDTKQRDYYSRTASDYDASHLESDPEHDFAAAILAGLLDFLSITSVLDVGSGTGRVMTHLKHVAPSVQIIGVEPVAALREIAYAKGLLPTEFLDGDATALAFADGAFDVVCAFGVLHPFRIKVVPYRRCSEWHARLCLYRT
jgi:ubiquinone/menaquinone biosynthesis C-methylase UbiE